MSEVTATEFAMLRDELRAVQARVDVIDQGGTRGVSGVAVQLTEVIKDVADVRAELRADVKDLRGDLANHRAEHEADARARVSGRRWLIGAATAALLAVEGPLAYVISHLHG